MNQTAIALRAIEHEVEALVALPANELPHAARTILRSITSLLMAVRWLVEDHREHRLAVVAGDGNDL